MDARFQSISPGATTCSCSWISRVYYHEQKNEVNLAGWVRRHPKPERPTKEMGTAHTTATSNPTRKPLQWRSQEMNWSSGLVVKPALQQNLERLALITEFAQIHYLLQQQKSWPQIQSRNQIYCVVGAQELLNLEINSIITSVVELINRNATNLLHKCTSARNRLHTCCFENKTDNLNQVWHLQQE